MYSRLSSDLILVIHESIQCVISLELQQRFDLASNLQCYDHDGRCLQLPSDYMKPDIFSNRFI